MRLNYYRFPEGVPPSVRASEGCAVRLKNGDTIYAESLPEDKLPQIEAVDDSLGGISVTHCKQLIKRYGGAGWTEHIDRDGGVFETSPITLSGNNSRFKYNHHL